MAQKTAITPTREQNYPEWYQQVIKAADLAENSPVRGCMTIKPWGYALWENLQQALDIKLKALGVKNIYCPLFIPLSFIEKEADHVEGFAKECAVVTHHRLQASADGGLEPVGKLEEPLVVRPTSEALMGEAFSRWIQSYRDLPMQVNQWANIVRWEMRTRMFLRTAEFLWQEGHTAHRCETNARQKARQILDLYANFVETYLAIPVIKGEKTAGERFPGAVATYCIEAMMQDKKALQAGTSHFLGQNFAKAFQIKFLNDQESEQFVWTTSWGVSTRLVGGLIMTHSDDDGLVLPPRIAPTQIVIMPVIRKGQSSDEILTYSENLAEALRQQTYHGKPLGVEVDKRDIGGGEKAWSWVKKGVPIRVEVGAKEVAAETVFVGRRDQSYRERATQERNAFVATVLEQLDTMQANILSKAKHFCEQNTVKITSEADFYAYFRDPTQSGFAKACWHENATMEAKIKKELNVTARCIPFSGNVGQDIFTGSADAPEVIFAKAY